MGCKEYIMKRIWYVIIRNAQQLNINHWLNTFEVSIINRNIISTYIFLITFYLISKRALYKLYSRSFFLLCKFIRKNWRQYVFSTLICKLSILLHIKRVKWHEITLWLQAFSLNASCFSSWLDFILSCD